MIRRLRLRRVSPQLLARKLKSNSRIAVLDLLDFEAEANSPSPEAIPGALRVEPSRLRKSPHITVPHGVDIVLYSSSGSDTVAARAAEGLKRVGIDNVWVLQGGLKAWREQGLPVAQSPEVTKSLQSALRSCQNHDSNWAQRLALAVAFADGAALPRAPSRYGQISVIARE